ncbi:alpha/beta fold hydrolase [Streptomyces sp. CA-278952]|uniref:thioesterase II family protein n=1 Tax=unclassified Streptomyces TaxID=2593676 RepID=UPI0022421F21|nr:MULTISPECIES: alpha/beta fold hydrolase [unclassified Streptomyces]UZI31663.1 alpha/beta fold hydrolase [Streptomyces sp. VB1]WDG31713.1 alpha/beta fold hydrolase [Streptomyces sp. CA-278952]
MSTLPGESPWLRNFRPAPDAPVRLVCLPHAGGSATFYVPVAQALSPGADVLAVQYPGRQDRRREPLIPDVGLLADRIAEALAPYNDRPLALFGHSMGALIGFEVARRLEAAGTVPAHLFVSGRMAPPVSTADRWHLAADKDLVNEVKSLGGTDTSFLDDPELLGMVLPAIRSDYQAVETYAHEPGPALNCQVTAFTGDNDPKADVDRVLLWGQHTTKSFTARVFPGGHFYLIQHIDALLRTMSTQLSLSPATAP